MPGQDNDTVSEPVPTTIDTSVASVARVYDAVLGGKDNYEVDRVVQADLEQACPEIGIMARDNRAWLIRVVRFLVNTFSGAGLYQILDCGSGLPTVDNTHQVAQRTNPDTRVVYVDNDPVVLVHGRALLEDNSQTAFAPADLTRPHELLSDPVVTAHLDLAQPIGLLQVGVLHHVDSPHDPYAIMRDYVDALPSGSWVAISHFHDPDDGSELADLAKRLDQVLQSSSSESGRFRTRAEIEAMFGHAQLVEPGLVRLSDWWPDGPRNQDLLDPQHLILGGLARIP